MSERRDFWAPVPLRLLRALQDGDIDLEEFAIGCYLALRSYEVTNTDDGIVSLRIRTMLDDFDWAENRAETARRKLHSLARKGWIVIEKIVERQRAPWRITLTGLAREGDCLATASQQGVATRQSDLAELQSRGSPNPLGETEAESPTVEVRGSGEGYRRDETRPEEKRLEPTPRTKGRIDPLLGETTSTASETEKVERLLAVMDKIRLEDLPEPGSSDYVAAVIRRFPKGHPERPRLFALHEAALRNGPRLDDVLEDEIAQLVRDGVVE
jgi:hypothetical protein